MRIHISCFCGVRFWSRWTVTSCSFITVTWPFPKWSPQQCLFPLLIWDWVISIHIWVLWVSDGCWDATVVLTFVLDLIDDSHSQHKICALTLGFFLHSDVHVNQSLSLYLCQTAVPLLLMIFLLIFWTICLFADCLCFAIWMSSPLWSDYQVLTHPFLHVNCVCL